jgi:DUF177 domain-containing protein
MKTNRQYDIAFVGLKQGIHEFSYQIEDKFFLAYSQPEFSETSINVKLTFDKNNSFFLLKFEITGAVKVNCDRCAEPFMLNIWDEFIQVVKLVDNPSEMTEDEAPDVSYIAKTDSHLNIADWIYEFILLSIPMQKIHPNSADGISGCNPEALKMLGQMSGKDHDNEINPIWKDLEKFKKN